MRVWRRSIIKSWCYFAHPLLARIYNVNIVYWMGVEWKFSQRDLLCSNPKCWFCSRKLRISFYVRQEWRTKCMMGKWKYIKFLQIILKRLTSDFVGISSFLTVRDISWWDERNERDFCIFVFLGDYKIHILFIIGLKMWINIWYQPKEKKCCTV